MERRVVHGVARWAAGFFLTDLLLGATAFALIVLGAVVLAPFAPGLTDPRYYLVPLGLWGIAGTVVGSLYGFRWIHRRYFRRGL